MFIMKTLQNSSPALLVELTVLRLSKRKKKTRSAGGKFAKFSKIPNSIPALLVFLRLLTETNNLLVLYPEV